MGETDLIVTSLADGVGTASAETDCGAALRGHDPVDVADAPVGCAGGQEGLTPRVHRHEHLRQVVSGSGVYRHRYLPVAADHADGFVGGDVGAGEVGVDVKLHSMERLELVKGQGQRVPFAEGWKKDWRKKYNRSVIGSPLKSVMLFEKVYLSWLHEY